MNDSATNITKDADSRMQKSLESLKADLGKIRTGRASVGLLDHVRVEFYGNPSPLSQVGNISVSDARTLTIKLWDKTMVQAVEWLTPLAAAGLAVIMGVATVLHLRRREWSFAGGTTGLAALLVLVATSSVLA